MTKRQDLLLLRVSCLRTYQTVFKKQNKIYVYRNMSDILLKPPRFAQIVFNFPLTCSQARRVSLK